MPETELIKVLESLEKVFKDITTWMDVQMSQNRLMKLQIRDLKDRVDKLEAIIEKEGENN